MEFSIQHFSFIRIAQRIVAIVDYPRPYIYCPHYFGPDRRRKTRPVTTERRVVGKEDVEVVYSGKELSALKTSTKQVWEFRIPRGLRTKLTGRGGSCDPSEPPFDPALIAAAEAKIATMEGDYSDWVAKSIENLTQAHHRALEEPARGLVHLKTINEIAHELRGQGGMFGYPLMTQFGKSLYDVTSEDASVSTKLLDLIDSHIDLIKVITKQKIKGWRCHGAAVDEDPDGSKEEIRSLTHVHIESDAFGLAPRMEREEIRQPERVQGETPKIWTVMRPCGN